MIGLVKTKGNISAEFTEQVKNVINELTGGKVYRINLAEKETDIGYSVSFER